MGSCSCANGALCALIPPFGLSFTIRPLESLSQMCFVCLLDRKALFLHHCHCYQISNSQGCFTCPLEKECMVRQLCVGCSQCSENPSHCHASSTLYVIIESAILLSVLLQQSEGVMVAKVFKLYQCVLTKSSDHSLHKFLNEFIIIFPCHSLMRQPNVVLIRE